MGEVLQNTSLTLGFFGDQDVHRTNMRDNLEDFIEGHFKKSHRNAVVRCIVSVEPFTNTMADIADWALTSGYHLGLIGHSDAFENEQVSQLMPQAEGLVIKVGPHVDIERALVLHLVTFDESRLILLADPNEDDDAYSAFVIARDQGLKVKSLLQGMDRVIMDVDDEQEPLHLVEDEAADDADDDDDDELGDDELGGEEEPDDDDDDDDEHGEVDLDQLAQEADEGNKEAAEELSELAQADGIDATQYDTWLEVVVAMRQGERPAEGTVDAEGYFDAAEVTADVPETQTDTTEPEPEEEPENEEEEPPVATAKTEYTPKQLQRWVDAGNLDKLIEIGEPYGLYPGRGHKPEWFMRHIIAAQGGTPIKTPAKKKVAAKKAPAKKKAAAKKAPAKKTAPVKAAAKKAPAKKVPTKEKTARTAPVRTPRVAAASTNGAVDKAAVRHFIKTARAALDVAESLI